MSKKDDLNQKTNSKPNDDDFSKISPTAKLVAYFREFTDIPFAREVSALIDAKTVTKKFCPDDMMLEDFKKFGAPGLEARYKSMISAINNLGITQVLELAAGLSFRGFVMTKNSNVTYVETDLKPMMDEKKAIIKKIPIMSDCLTRSNLFLESVNALSLTDLQKSLRHFDKTKPIAIVHEGLYQYLSRPEKEILARNIHQILSEYGGFWITPDFMIDSEASKILAHPKARALMEQMTKTIETLTTRNLGQDQFKDQRDLSEFLTRAGFTFKVAPQIDGSFELSSLKVFPMADEHLGRMRDALRLWILSVAGK